MSSAELRHLPSIYWEMRWWVVHGTFIHPTTPRQILCERLLTQIERDHSAANYIIVYVHTSRTQSEIWGVSVIFLFILQHLSVTCACEITSLASQQSEKSLMSCDDTAHRLPGGGQSQATAHKVRNDHVQAVFTSFWLNPMCDQSGDLVRTVACSNCKILQ